jgi:hypothetical protein
MDREIEPTVEKTPAPVWPIVLALVLAYFGAVYSDFIRQSWGNHSPTVSADEVRASRAAIAGNEVK